MLAFLIAAGAVFLAVAVSAAIDLIRPSLMSLNEGSCGVRKRGLRVMQTVVVKPLHDCRGIDAL